jgi:acyl-CoA thioester hydrolase
MMPVSHARSTFRFFHPFRVRYSEIDGQAVVYNAHYLTFFDTAIFEFYRVIGYDQFREAKERQEDWHVVRALVEYKVPLVYDLEFEVAVRIDRMGNSSLTYALAIFPKGGDTLLSTGEIVQVYTDQVTHKPMRIPDDVRARFAIELPAGA